MDAWMDGWMDEQTDGWTTEWIDGQAGRMDRQTGVYNRRTYKWLISMTICGVCVTTITTDLCY